MKNNVKSRVIISLILGIIILNSCHMLMQKRESKIHVLTLVGADAILLESDGHFGLVDAGEDLDYPDGTDLRYPFRSTTTTNPAMATEDKVISYLKSVGVTKENLDFFLGTHAHSDHIGAADEIIREFEPDRVYLTEYSDEYIEEYALFDYSVLWDNQYVYDHAVNAANEVDAELIQSFNNDNAKFTLGDMKLEIVNYLEDYKTTPKLDANAFSLGVKVEVNGHTAFLAGDIDNSDGDEDRLADYIGKVEIFKISHHGYNNPNVSILDSNTDAYLEKLSPSIAILTQESYNLNKRIENKLQELNASIIATGEYDDVAQAIVVDLSKMKITTNVDNVK